MSNNFYSEFIEGGFFEKKASENANIKSTLSNLDPAVLEKLAQEIEGYADNESDLTLEQKLAAEEDSEKDKEKDKEEKDKEEKESADDSEKDKEEKDKEEKESADDSEKDKEEKDKEEKESADDSEKDKEEKDKEEKESADDCEKDEEVIKQAYELAEQKLASNGFSVADFVFEKCANEEVSLFIAENAEKLASLSDKPILQVADEILSTLSEKLG